MPLQSLRIQRGDIKTTDLGQRLNQVKCAITQESVKYKNKILTKEIFAQV